ncbi:hypothetical protein JFT66_18645 [Pseudomonas sp. MF6755]|uniref:hypothetical protein n=1 Tax=Pseudomonas sp. MF6755 TaxID=2797530 RepID=UPI0018E7F138|nr:hypothetical protein [Pseudomonas sp. MF6755]MBJ2286176.1 hypothetical protein [Pseudomonas sp. MF6755]
MNEKAPGREIWGFFVLWGWGVVRGGVGCVGVIEVGVGSYSPSLWFELCGISFFFFVVKINLSPYSLRHNSSKISISEHLKTQ